MILPSTFSFTAVITSLVLFCMTTAYELNFYTKSNCRSPWEIHPYPMWEHSINGININTKILCEPIPIRFRHRITSYRLHTSKGDWGSPWGYKIKIYHDEHCTDEMVSVRDGVCANLPHRKDSGRRSPLSFKVIPIDYSKHDIAVDPGDMPISERRSLDDIEKEGATLPFERVRVDGMTRTCLAKKPKGMVNPKPASNSKDYCSSDISKGTTVTAGEKITPAGEDIDYRAYDDFEPMDTGEDLFDGFGGRFDLDDDDDYMHW